MLNHHLVARLLGRFPVGKHVPVTSGSVMDKTKNLRILENCDSYLGTYPTTHAAAQIHEIQVSRTVGLHTSGYWRTWIQTHTDPSLDRQQIILI